MLGTGYFLKINSQQKKNNVSCSSRYHSFKQKLGLFQSFNPHSTIARSHTTRNRDFL